MAQLVKNLPAMWQTWVQFLGWEDPLEKGKVLQYPGQENSIGRKESDMTERPSLTHSGREELSVTILIEPRYETQKAFKLE